MLWASTVRAISRLSAITLAVLPVSVIAERREIARTVVAHSIHPAFSPDVAEDALVNPALQVAPKDWWSIGMVRSSFLGRLRKTSAPFLNDLGEPIGNISLGILDGPNPQCEGLPGDAVFPG